jgi:hypothetical protein
VILLEYQISSEKIDTNCVNDFDLAKEVTLNIDSKNYSNEIVLNSKIITGLY